MAELYVEAGYVEPGYIEGIIDAAATLSSTWTLIAEGLANNVPAEAAIGCTATMTVLGGLRLTPEGLCGTYTWDSTGTWVDWPNNIWGPDGWCGHVQTLLAAFGALVQDQPVPQVYSMVATATALGNHIFQVPATLPAVFTQTTQGNYIWFGEPEVFSVTATMPTLGNHIFQVPATLDSVTAVLVPFSGLLQSGIAPMLVVADLPIDQSGLNGIAGLFFRAQADLSVIADLPIDQSGLNGIAGLFFRAQAQLPAIYSTANFAVFIPRDPYRSWIVYPETRVIRVSSDRMCGVQGTEARILCVQPEDRVLIDGLAPYDTIRRRKV